MSQQFQIISDSSCDLAPAFAEAHNVKIVPFYVSFDKETYYKEEVELPIRELYQKMADDPELFPKTSLPSIEDYINTFEPFVKEGIPVICICISSKFSGSFNAASNAKNILLDDYPDAKIAVIDSQLVTVLQGLFVTEAVRMQENGLSFEASVEHLERIKDTGRIFFTTADISYLKTGGRIGKLMSVANNALKIKPLILFKEGELFPVGVTRNRKKSLSKVLEQAKKYLTEMDDKIEDYSIISGYGYDEEEGLAYRDMVLEEMKTITEIDSVETFQIGATIGVHTGPHPIGVGILKRYDA
ncbi:MAG: DegV family protein [Lachnospiraceae bacterium]|nr:DegV family protein [Lachnospiraceae bacterium]